MHYQQGEEGTDVQGCERNFPYLRIALFKQVEEKSCFTLQNKKGSLQKFPPCARDLATCLFPVNEKAVGILVIDFFEGQNHTMVIIELFCA